MTHFFDRRDRWGHGLAIWVLAFMVFILPLSYYALRGLHLENDIENWLPENDPQAIALDWYQNQFDVEESIFVTWDGSTLDDPRIKLFEHALEPVIDEDGIAREGSPYFDAVATPHEALHRMMKQRIDQDEAVRRLTGTLIGRGPLRLKLTDVGRRRMSQTIAELKALAWQELNLVLVVSEPFDAGDIVFSDDQIERLSEIEARAEAARDPDDDTPEAEITFPEHDLVVSWRGIDHKPEEVEKFTALVKGMHSPTSPKLPQGETLVEDCFFTPGSPVAVVLAVSEAGDSDKKEMLAAIREAAKNSGIPDDALHLGGRSVASLALNSDVVKAGWNSEYPAWNLYRSSPILLSVIVSVGLAFLMLRSVKLTIMVLSVSGYTIFVTMSLVPVTGGSLNMVIVVMPTLLMVLTISAAIHLANYWKHSTAKNPATAITEAVKMALKPCAMASITTAIGLMSLATSTLAPVRDFGIYSAVGCLISLAVVMLGLPSLLQLWPSQSAVKVVELDSRPWHKLGDLICSRSLIVSLLFIATGIVCSLGLQNFRTETKVIRYFPEKSRVVQDYRMIEENLTGIVAFDCIVKFDENARDELNFLERMEVVRQVQDKIRTHREVSGTISLADFLPKQDIPPKTASFLQRGSFNRKSTEVEERLHEPGNEAASRRFISPAVPEGVEAVANSKHHYTLSAPSDELWRVTAQVGIMSDADYGNISRELDEITQSVLKMHPGTSHIVTGMAPIFLRTQQAVLESLIESFAYAFVLIAIVMMLVLKDFVAGLIAMIPNILPVSIVFGLISWYGIAVDIGTMITASVALGIAVDGTLHLLTWFRENVRSGMSRTEAVSEALGHCGPAMWQTSIAIGIGMLMLYGAELLLVSRFGWLMAALIGAALLGDIILLPALLNGFLGMLIERRVKKEQSSPTSSRTPQEDTKASSVREPHLQSFSHSTGQILRKDPGNQLGN